MALTAFTEYARKVFGDADNNIQVSLEANLQNGLVNLDSHTFDEISRDNALVLQQFQVTFGSFQSHAAY